MKIGLAFPTFASKQAGIATVAIAFLIVLLMGVAVLGASTLATGVSRDSGSEHARIQALFMAETAIERASYRFNNGIACNSLGESNITMTSTAGTTLGTVTITSFTTGFDGTTAVGSNCRVRASATTASGQIVRVIESMIQPSGGFSTRGNHTFACTVPTTGSSRAVVVTMGWTTSGTGDYPISGVSLNGTAMTAAGAVVTNSDSSGVYKAQNFYLLDPSTGSSVSGNVTFSGGNPTAIDYACIVFTGVTSSAGSPIEVTNSSAPSSTVSSVSAALNTGSTSGTRYLVDNLVRASGGNWSADSIANCSNHDLSSHTWKSNANGNAGAGSFCGTVAASTNVTLSWGGSSKKVAYAALAIYATGETSENSARVSDTSTTTGALSGWREITVPPS
jgi:hypothetical protein